MGKLFNLGGKKKGGGNPIAMGIAIVLVIGAVAYIGLPAIGDLAEKMGWTGTGGGIPTTTTPTIVQPVASNLWDAKGSLDIKAPDINITIEDARFSSTEAGTNPTTDDIYVYWFTENPLTLTPSKTFHSDYDRLTYLIEDTRFLMGTSGIDWGTASQNVLGSATLTAVAKSPTTYGETDGKLYALLVDHNYVEGTPGTLINGFPVVLEVDMKTIPAYSVQTTATHTLSFGKTMAGISKVYPADAGGASQAWGTRSAGWPELGTATVTLPTANVPADLNSTANNYQGAQIVLGDGGVYFWQDCELAIRIDANSTTQTFNKFTINGEQINDVKKDTVGGIAYYFVKVPRDRAVAGQTIKILAYYDQTEEYTRVDYMPCIVEWNSMGAQMATSAYARIADLDTTNITSSVGCP